MRRDFPRPCCPFLSRGFGCYGIEAPAPTISATTHTIVIFSDGIVGSVTLDTSGQPVNRNRRVASAHPVVSSRFPRRPVRLKPHCRAQRHEYRAANQPAELRQEKHLFSPKPRGSPVSTGQTHHTSTAPIGAGFSAWTCAKIATLQGCRASFWKGAIFGGWNAAGKWLESGLPFSGVGRCLPRVAIAGRWQDWGADRDPPWAPSRAHAVDMVTGPARDQSCCRRAIRPAVSSDVAGADDAGGTAEVPDALLRVCRHRTANGRWAAAPERRGWSEVRPENPTRCRPRPARRRPRWRTATR
jgi:hypothetical protein